MKVIFTFTLMFLFHTSTVSGGPASDDFTYQEINPKIEKFVQDVTFATYINKISEVTRQVVTQQKIGVVPQFVQLAIHKLGYQAFQKTSIKDTVREAYSQGMDVAHDLYSQKKMTHFEQTVKSTIEGEIETLVGTPLFKKLIEEVVRQAMIQQQRMAIQQAYVKQQMYQQAVQKMFQQAVFNQQKKVQHAVQQQYKQSVEDQYKYQMQQYEAAFQSSY